jgi:predicted O-methyltransferase YrrM
LIGEIAECIFRNACFSYCNILGGLVTLALIAIAGFTVAFSVFYFDLRRRRLSLSRILGWSTLSALDVIWPAVIAGTATGLAIGLVPAAISNRALPLDSPAVWRIAACAVVFAYLWGEGRRAIQFQRPDGIVFGEGLILLGTYLLIESAVLSTATWQMVAHPTVFRSACILLILAGAAVTSVVVARYLRRFEGHRILDRIAEKGESVQAEYVPATAECPHPELWKMVDAQTSELEVLDFLKSIVTTAKPELIVETGTFLGYGTLKMAEGLRENGFGRIITIEHDPAIFAKAKERIETSGLSRWIEYRHESSLEARIDGTIDMLFSDSWGPIREKEVRRFLPQIDSRGLILVHDAGSHFGVVREAMLRMEREGLISTVLVSTPRGLAIAQKREGRK